MYRIELDIKHQHQHLEFNGEVDADEKIVADSNNLYISYLKSKKGSDWKGQVQKYEFDFLEEIYNTKQELRTRTYKCRKGEKFIIRERGKTRNIRSNPFYDRVIRRCFSDYVLYPQLKRYIAYDNGASLENKGISFTRKRFVAHLHKYYRKHHSNKGYILLIDFSKYYDNIIHKYLKKLIRKYIKSNFSLWLYDIIIDNFRIDVSFLTDEQFKECLKKKFDGLKYAQMDESNFTGKKFMDKSLGIGDQVSQISSVFFPTDIDNYCKIVLRIKCYDRYMDDTSIIDENKETLKYYFYEIKKIADDKGIFINNRKTRICKIGEWFTFLQFRYKLTSRGRVLIRINPNTIVRERRKLKKFKVKFDDGEITFKDINTQYSSWMGNFYKYMSKNQRTKMNDLFNELFVNDFVAYGGNKYSKNIIANKKKRG